MAKIPKDLTPYINEKLKMSLRNSKQLVFLQLVFWIRLYNTLIHTVPQKVSEFPFGIVIPKSESKEKRRGQTYLKTISSPSEIKKEIVPGIPLFEIQNYSPI